MPPRNVQAPQRRDTSKGSPLAEIPVWVWIVSAVAVVGGVLIIYLVTSASSSGNATPAAVK